MIKTCFVIALSLTVASGDDRALRKPENLEEESRIAGGQTARDSYPYMLSVQEITFNKTDATVDPVFNPDLANTTVYWIHFCGGAVVNHAYFVTAASCMVPRIGKITSVLVGTNDLTEEVEGLRHLFGKCEIHPRYKNGSLDNDIATCRILTMFPIGTFNVAPIPLSEHFVRGNVRCILTGWGYTRPFQQDFPKDLHSVQLSTISNEQCNMLGFNGKIHEKEICTFSPGQGACGRDNGGPLQCNNKLVGIVSLNEDPCGSGRTVYTRVTAYFDWIKKTTTDPN